MTFSWANTVKWAQRQRLSYYVLWKLIYAAPEVIHGGTYVGSSLLEIKADVWVVKSVRVFDGLSKEEDWRQELMDLAGGNLYVPLKVGFARMGGVVQ